MAFRNSQHPDLPYLATPTKLNSSGDNYESWSTQMLYLIHRQGMLAFIVSSHSQQANANRDDGIKTPEIDEDWVRKDHVLRQWLLSQLDYDIVDPVPKTSRDVWLELQTKFQQDGGDVIEIVIEQQNPVRGIRDYDKYFPLYRAAIEGDWITAERIFQNDPTAMSARIDATKSTTLHMAVGAGEKAIDFVKNLLAQMPDGLIAAKDDMGCTALSIAAAVGNLKAAYLLVEKMPNLLYTANSLGIFPVHTAALYSQELVLWYLIAATKDDCEQNPYAGLSGIALLISCIEAEYLVLATYLVANYPYLATLKVSSNSASKSVVEKKFKFSDSESLGFLKELDFMAEEILKELPVSTSSLVVEEGKAHYRWRYFMIDIYQSEGDNQKDLPTVSANKRTVQLELVKLICKKMVSLMSNSVSEDIYCDAILSAAKLDMDHIVKVIIKAFPCALHCISPDSLQSIYHVAVENCSRSTLSIIYRMNNDHKHRYLNIPDINGNNILHLAAKLSPLHKLNEMENAALQMHHEVEWYKVVEYNVHRHSSERLNYKGKSPKMIFMEEHKSMREEAEKWYKNTASSCTIVGTLIGTIMFAAAITVPGGSNGTTGFPIFSKNSVFVFFAVSDAVSLLSSATSILCFLDIMSSGYTEKDFYLRLPLKMMVGMISLILSLTFMVLSFSALLYLVFGKKHHWVLITVAIAVCYSIYYFWILQLPLLIAMINVFPKYDRLPTGFIKPTLFFASVLLDTPEVDRHLRKKLF